jgi:stage II sporulation SpoAA-like protein
MPFVVFRDTARRRLEIAANGTLTFDDFRAILRLRAGDVRSYTVLFDASGATPTIALSELHDAADRVKGHVEREGPRGRFAIVAADEAMFGLAHTYAQLCERAGIETIGVFSNREEAERWLSGV